jgi:GT2 family glycosyltransferase
MDPEGDARVRMSVVIPCRNGGDLFARQLDALVAQDWDDGDGAWEVIVSDNGSTDGSAEMARAYADRLPGLAVVDASAVAGRHYACNAGVRHATGDLIVFVDADDEVEPGYLRAMARALDDQPLVAGRLDHRALDPAWMDGVGSGFQDKGLEDGFGFLPFGAGASLGFRRSAFEAVGGFRERASYCEDVDICWRAQLAGHRIGFVPDAVVRYRSRATVTEMFSQHRNFGRARALLYHDYRASGMPARSTVAAAREWWFIARAVPRLRTRTELARWARRLGRSVGSLEGSVRYRAWYP